MFIIPKNYLVELYFHLFTLSNANNTFYLILFEQVKLFLMKIDNKYYNGLKAVIYL